MSREIKFRVARKEKNGWRIYAPSSIIDLWNSSNVSYNIMQKELTAYENGELVFLEYTGLKDKNGLEIYEGDIIFNDDRKENAVVKYNESKAMFIVEYLESKDSFPLVGSINNLYYTIGNIYEHPKLLKP